MQEFNLEFNDTMYESARTGNWFQAFGTCKGCTYGLETDSKTNLKSFKAYSSEEFVFEGFESRGNQGLEGLLEIYDCVMSSVVDLGAAGQMILSYFLHMDDEDMHNALDQTGNMYFSKACYILHIRSIDGVRYGLVKPAGATAVKSQLVFVPSKGENVGPYKSLGQHMVFPDWDTVNDCDVPYAIKVFIAGIFDKHMFKNPEVSGIIYENEDSYFLWSGYLWFKASKLTCLNVQAAISLFERLEGECIDTRIPANVTEVETVMEWPFDWENYTKMYNHKKQIDLFALTNMKFGSVLCVQGVYSICITKVDDKFICVDCGDKNPVSQLQEVQRVRVTKHQQSDLTGYVSIGCLSAREIVRLVGTGMPLGATLVLDVCNTREYLDERNAEKGREHISSILDSCL